LYLYLLIGRKQHRKLESVQESKEEKTPSNEYFNLEIKIFKTQQINTREGKRVINSCLTGDYIPGLIYIPDFISENEELQIREHIITKHNEWRDHWIKTNRKWLQFGYYFNYKTMELYKNKTKGFENIPAEWQWIGQRIQSCIEERLGQKCKDFNQLLINQYAPNQGINYHTDKTHCFGPVIADVSLFSCCVINYKDKMAIGNANKNKIKSVLLQPRSLVVMTGPSRYEWLHGIEAKREHKFCGHRIRQDVRYSFTFRHAMDVSSEVLPQTRFNAVSAKAMDY